MSQGIRITALLLGVATGLHAQATLHVPGVFPTIQSAVSAATDSDVVHIAPGIYSENVVVPDVGIRIRGSGPASQTIVDAGGGRAFELLGTGTGGTIFEHLTIQNGSDPNGGTAVLMLGPGNVAINDCRILGHSVTNGLGGGAVYVIGSAANLGTLQVNRTHFEGNGSGTTPGVRGVALHSAIDATIEDCVFQSNGSWPVDSIVFLDGQNATIRNSRFLFNNTGVHLATRFNQNSRLVENCVFLGNGPRSLHVSSDADVHRCTFAFNPGTPETIRVTGLGNAIRLRDSIVWGNTPSNPVQATSNATLSFDYCNLENLPASGVGNISSDPEFFGGYEWHIHGSSPCRDAGDPAVTAGGAVDIDGEPRVLGPRIDIGADEYSGQGYEGTIEDLVLVTLLGSAPVPLGPTTIKPAFPGDSLSIIFGSPFNTFTGEPVVLAAQAFPTGSPPTPLVPAIHLDPLGVPGPVLILGASTPFGPPLLPSSNMIFRFAIPPGLAGTSMLVQGLCLSSLAANGGYATTNGHELQMQ